MIDFTSLNSFRGKDLKFQLKEHALRSDTAPRKPRKWAWQKKPGPGLLAICPGERDPNDVTWMAKKTHILNSAAMSLGELGFFTRGTWFGGSCV